MKFLDRMVSDLVRSSTGYDARRLVRAVGGRNILLAAGAAIAGGVLSQKMQHGSSAPGDRFTGHPPPSSPPLPPIPAVAATPPATPAMAAAPPSLPPLPPMPPPSTTAAGVPAGTDAAEEDDFGELPPELTYAIVRTMVAAALADGDLGAEEKDMIHRHLGESGLAPAQVRRIHQDLVLPPSPSELADLAPAGTARETLYRFGALVVLADGKAGDLERGWLVRLASAFEISAERQAKLDQEVLAAAG